MRLSILGLILGAAYLTVPLYQAVQVIRKNSFGGIFSQEFALFVVTLPASPLAELLFKRHDYVRLAAYLLCALLNAGLLYFIGMGLAVLVDWIGRAP